MRKLSTEGFWLLAFGSWLLALGFWLLAFGSWLLALGFWLLAFGSWLLALGFWLLAKPPTAKPLAANPGHTGTGLLEWTRISTLGVTTLVFIGDFSLGIHGQF